MKYKNIYSAIHNFSQSFMSGMNYFEDDHVMYDVYQMANKSEERAVSLNFSNGTCSHPKLATLRVYKSLTHYSLRLSKHLKSHDVEPSSVHEVKLTINCVNPGHQLVAEAIDNRGKSYKINVSPA